MIRKTLKRASDTLRKLTELPNAIRSCRAMVRELSQYYENNEGPGPANALVAELIRQRDKLLRVIDESGKAFILAIDDREAVLTQIKAERDELGKALSERDRDVVQLRTEVERLRANIGELENVSGVTREQVARLIFGVRRLLAQRKNQETANIEILRHLGFHNNARSLCELAGFDPDSVKAW